MSKIKATILLTVFIDVIGFGIVIPILPFYVAGYSSSALLLTSLFSVYALCAFLSAPLIGALSDRFGRRPMLIMSIFSTALGWFVFAWAPSIPFLFLGRILDGIMAGNLPIAQSYLSDVAKDEKERTTNMGFIGAIWGIAFIVGPMLGGVLGHLGNTVPFWFVGFLAFGNGILALFLLVETNTMLSTRAVSLNPFTPLKRAIKNQSLRINYLAWFLFGLAIANYQSVFSLYFRDVFGFNELNVGVIFGLTGIVIALNQGFAMKHLWLKFFKEPILELCMLAIFASGFFLLSSSILFVVGIALLLTTFGQSILRVVMTSQVVGVSPKDQRGEALGIMSSITSLSMMVGPVLAGFMYESNNTIPFYFGALCLLVAFWFLYQKRKELEAMSLPEDVVMESMI